MYIPLIYCLNQSMNKKQRYTLLILLVTLLIFNRPANKISEPNKDTIMMVSVNDGIQIRSKNRILGVPECSLLDK